MATSYYDLNQTTDQHSTSSNTNQTTKAISIADMLDTYISKRFESALEKAFPGYRDVMGQMTANVQAGLRGDLPADVARTIRMQSGEMEQQGALSSTARNLGITSLERADASQQLAGQLFDIQKGLMPPQSNVPALEESLRSSALTKEKMYADYKLSTQELRVQADMFNAQLDWDKQLSALNQQWEQEQFNYQKDLLRQLLRRSEAGYAATSPISGTAGAQVGSGTTAPKLGKMPEDFYASWEKHFEEWNK